MRQNAKWQAYNPKAKWSAPQQGPFCDTPEEALAGLLARFPNSRFRYARVCGGFEESNVPGMMIRELGPHSPAFTVARRDFPKQ